MTLRQRVWADELSARGIGLLVDLYVFQFTLYCGGEVNREADYFKLFPGDDQLIPALFQRSHLIADVIVTRAVGKILRVLVLADFNNAVLD